MSELERAKAEQAFWKEYLPEGWRLVGWSCQVSAGFIGPNGECAEVEPGVLALLNAYGKPKKAEDGV